MIRGAWAARRTLETRQLSRADAAFLPHVLAIQESPPHPLPSAAAAVVSALVAIATLLLAFVELDIVVVSQGKIIPGQHTKQVQAQSNGLVTTLRARDGGILREGDVLLEIDAAEVRADIARQDKEIAHLEDVQRDLNGLVELTSCLNGSCQMSERLLTALSTSAQSEYAAESLQLRLLQIQREKSVAEIKSADAAVARVLAALPVVEKKSADYAELVKEGFLSRHSDLDQSRLLVDTRAQLVVAEASRREAAVAAEETEAKSRSFLADTLNALRRRIDDNQEKLVAATAGKIRSELALGHSLVRSPIAGTVQQLTVHGAGENVQANATIAQIVPLNDEMLADVLIESKDRANLQIGSEAEVKLDAYPFSRHGVIRGRVQELTSDAIALESKGLFYPAKVKLLPSRDELAAAGINIVPGLSLTAEIKTGRRRLFEYFWSPLRAATAGTFKEK
ncbi:HlyD family type I secretion periplasmic adaptor subunit [Roseateles chitinivorans]|uniref:HlyD family type I secretion periplasmic adaptor subunit n=1 Tax=Roseateles chitinivorans TaxID=2917965 RepID=UPI003D673CF3